MCGTWRIIRNDTLVADCMSADNLTKIVTYLEYNYIGVKDGVPYSTEEEIEFDDPALAELY